MVIAAGLFSGLVVRLVLGAARLFLLGGPGFVAGSGRVRQRPGSHIRLLGSRTACPGRLDLEREGSCALGRDCALPFGRDLLDPHILCRSLLALVS